jgi:hypothetical protein
MNKPISLLTILLIAVSAPAAVIHVDPNGTGDYPTIRDAVNAAKDGDEVVLADGTYTLQGDLYIIINRHITVRSENGPERCIIDCNGSPQEFRGAFRINSDATIAGITIVSGYTIEGGAILCFEFNLQIINCVLRDNFSDRNGGAMVCRKSNVTILNSRISNNTAPVGGGIFCGGGTLYIDKSTINDNLATEGDTRSGGGGIYCELADLTIIDSSIINNIAQNDYEFRGGGILCKDMLNLTILNSVISGNICRANAFVGGGGIYCEYRYYQGNRCIIADSVISENVAECTQNKKAGYGGGMYLIYGNPIITKCIISGNSAASGAGISFNSCYSTVDNSIVNGNGHFLKKEYPNYQAGGISCDLGYTNIVNCAILGNSGYGVFGHSNGAKIENSIICANKYGDDYQCQIIDKYSDYVTVSNSNVQMNEPGSPPWPGIGNINADPCFVNAGYWDSNGTPDDCWDDFWVDGDYHLKSPSLCIESGGYVPVMLSDTDLDEKPRIVGSAVDMGPYENQLPCIKVKLQCIPCSLNVHSRYKIIIALLTMPDGITPDDIDPNEPLLFEPGQTESERQIVYLSDCMEQFSDGPNKITVKGKLKTGRCYFGTDTIHVVSWKRFQ